MLKQILLSLSLLLLVGCGRSSSSNSTIHESNITSFKDKELYSFKLNFIDHRQRYDMLKSETGKRLDNNYFDFESKEYRIESQEKQLFINAQRTSSSQLDYSVKENGALEVLFNNQVIMKFTLLSNKQVKLDRLQEYGSNIAIEGTQYSVTLDYLSNFYQVKELTSDATFKTLETFIQSYQNKPFKGSIIDGLYFDGNNTLTQRIDNINIEAGRYELKELDGKNVLLLQPNNTQRYGTNTCYLLDFNRVWESECHLKETHEDMNFYDKAIYDSVLEYMQTAFVNIQISI